jgi:hypothetical protein
MLTEQIDRRMPVSTIAVLPRVHDIFTHTAVKVFIPPTGNGFERSTILQFNKSQEATTLVSHHAFPIHIMSGNGTELKAEASTLTIVRPRYDQNGEHPGIRVKIPLAGVRLSGAEYYKLIEHTNGMEQFTMYTDIFNKYLTECTKQGVLPYNPMSFQSYILHTGMTEDRFKYEPVEEKNNKIAQHICELLEGPVLLLEQAYGTTGDRYKEDVIIPLGFSPDTYTRYDILRMLMMVGNRTDVPKELHHAVVRAKILARVIGDFSPKSCITLGDRAEYMISEVLGKKRVFSHDTIEQNQLGKLVITRLCTPIFQS